MVIVSSLSVAMACVINQMSKNNQKSIGLITFLSIIIVSLVASTLVYRNWDADHLVNAITGKPSKIFLKIENFKISRGPTGAIDVTGKVINNSTKNVQDVKLTASYYDDTNSLLGKTIKFLSHPSDTVKPNDVKDFNFVETITFARIDHSNVNATANEAK